MLSANFKPKITAAASRGFLAIARLSCILTWHTGHLFFPIFTFLQRSNFLNSGNEHLSKFDIISLRCSALACTETMMATTKMFSINHKIRCNEVKMTNNL